ncbi:hypothetical protein EVAR_98950_1 [Eumeta japonica]|uniref:Uncharacterized protein n=1 Tax=Eumeta variegata TaxID=151549 RepID=A0A4C2ADY7_EUMVA|nr:hypothetical protein EVAR_98950_1 [Eumeta japonica]
MARRHERTHSTRRHYQSRSSSRLTLSSLLYVLAYTNDIRRPSSSSVQLALFADDTTPFTEVGLSAIHPPPPQTAIVELGQWFRSGG